MNKPRLKYLHVHTKMGSLIFSLFAVLVILIIMPSHSCFGQSNYIGLGNPDTWNAIIRFEVLDMESHTPVRNVKIALYDGSTKVFSISTDGNGVGAVIIHEWAYFPGGTFKVTAPNYRYWVMEEDQYYFYTNRKKNMIAIPDYNTGYYLDWTSTSCCPSDAQLAKYLSNGKYEIFRGNYFYVAPGLFEYTIELEKTEGGYYHQDNYSQNESPQYGFAVDLTSSTPRASNIDFEYRGAEYDSYSKNHWRINSINGYMKFEFEDKQCFSYHVLGSTSAGVSYCEIDVYVNGQLYENNKYVSKNWHWAEIPAYEFVPGNNKVVIVLVGQTHLWIDKIKSGN